MQKQDASPEDRNRLALSHGNIGLLLDEMNRTDAAITALDQSRHLHQATSDANPQSSRLRHELAVCYNNLGLVLGRHRPADSIAALAKPARSSSDSPRNTRP